MDKMFARLGLPDWRSLKALGAVAFVVLLVNGLSVVSASQPIGKGVWSPLLAGATSVDPMVQAGAPDPLPQTVMVQYDAETVASSTRVRGSDAHSLNLGEPAIHLEKTGDILSEVGEPVHYTITLYNNCSPEYPPLQCTITDEMLGINKSVILKPGESDVTNATYTVQPDDLDPLVNTATAICSLDEVSKAVLAKATWSVRLFQPAIRLEKTGDALSKVGDEVGYTITLHNESSRNSPDLKCTITDNMLRINKSVTLAAGASDVTNATYRVPEGAADPLVNRATATCHPIGVDYTLEAEASWSAELFQPAIRLEKTGDALSKVGDEVGYTITLHNESSLDSPPLECTISDPMLSMNKDVTLAAGASDVTNATYRVPEGAADPLVNRATATCSPIGFPNVLVARDDHSVNLFQLSIRFDKTGDILSKVGDDVDYRLTLNNTSSGDSPPLECTITDSMLGINKSVTLAAGASDVTNATHTVPDGASDPLVNRATASCRPVGFPGVLEARDDHSVNLFQPAIRFDKTGDTQSRVGDDVDYRLTLNNTSSGDSPPLECTITDDMLGINKSVTLAAGASDVTNATYRVPEGAADPLVNRATATCSPIGFPNVLEASDDHSVNLFQLSIRFDKTGDTQSRVGDDVDYRLTLNNTSSGDSPPLECTITDDMLGIEKQVTLAAGESDVTNATYTVRQGDADPLTNTAYAFCSRSRFTDLLDAKARWSVDLFQPAIRLEKIGGDLSQVGDEVGYTITLYNESSGDSPLLECTITDDMLGIRKQVTLAAGESDVTNATYTVLRGDADPLSNTAYAFCSPSGFAGLMDAKARWSVNLFQPAVEVTKEGDAYTKIDPITGEGDIVTYLFTIRNTSSIDSPSLILDSMGDVGDGWDGLGDLSAEAAAAGCDRLEPASSCAFSLDRQYQEADPDPLLKNRVTVRYQPEGFRNDISSSDEHQVTVLHPDFAVTKTCVTQPVRVGQPAEFEIVIANMGDVPLVINTNESAIPGDIWLDPNGSKTYTVYKDADPDADEVYNQVIVSATLPETYGLANVMEKRADDVCEVEEPPIVGFTPGFWKDHWGDPAGNQENAWKYTAYDPHDTLCTFEGEMGVFECSGLTSHIVEASGDNTLLSGLSLGGGLSEEGAAETLLRTGVATLLNASLSEELGFLGVPGFPAFPHSSQQVIDMINDALAPDAANPGETPDEHRARMLELASYFDRLNNSSSIEFDWNWPWLP